MIDNLYNPDSMSKEDIKTLFVARQPLLDELVATVKNQPQGAGVQHVLIIAPRGMGKTTMLLMLQFAIEDSTDLSKIWQPIRFPEESYDITELADFWLKVLRYLADATNDERLKTKITEIEKRFPESEDLREAAWATVKDWSKAHKKRIALMVDNFDMILSQINNDTEQARLRDVLMNDGTVMLVGCAPSYFRAIQDYGQPLYNFFKIYNLSDLRFPDIEQLLNRRAEIDNIENIQNLFQKNKTRIKALEVFTGGNPRLLLMLYRILTKSEMSEVKSDLDRLLDDITPFFKDKTEKLPPQQRKIIDQIAQYSLETNEGVSPTEIARRTRMTPNQVSSQLKRMSENGYVKALNIRGRTSYYVISEPLYVIWSQMRFGRNAREKRRWLVAILKALFDSQELTVESVKLHQQFEDFLSKGRLKHANDVLEHHLCLEEAISSNEHKQIIAGSVEDESLKLGKVYLDKSKKDICNDKTKRALDLFYQVLEKSPTNLEANYQICRAYYYLKEFEKALDFCDKTLKIDDDFHSAWHAKGLMLQELGKLDEALFCANAAVEKGPRCLTSRELRGEILVDLKKYSEALADCDYVIERNKKSHNAWHDKSIAHLRLKQYKDALNASNKAVETNKNCTVSWYVKGNCILAYLDNHTENIDLVTGLNEAIISFKKANNERWIQAVTKFFIRYAKRESLKDVKNLVVELKLEEELFSFIQAIDYLETKDETLIEKLSPEVRVVVEETIRTLRMVAEEKVESKPTQKAKSKNDRKSDKSLALSE